MGFELACDIGCVGCVGICVGCGFGLIVTGVVSRLGGGGNFSILGALSLTFAPEAAALAYFKTGMMGFCDSSLMSTGIGPEEAAGLGTGTLFATTGVVLTGAGFSDSSFGLMTTGAFLVCSGDFGGIVGEPGASPSSDASSSLSDLGSSPRLSSS